MPIIRENPERRFGTHSAAQTHAKREAAKTEEPKYIVKTAFTEAPYVVVLTAPMIGQWWQVYPDGLTIQRG